MTESRTEQSPATQTNTPFREPTNEELGLATTQHHGASPAPLPSRPRRHVGRRIGRTFAGIGVAALAVFGIGYAVTPTQTSQDHWDVASGTINAVNVDLSRGDVEITESPDGAVHWSEDLKYKGGKYTTHHEVQGKTLVIDTDHSALRWGFNWGEKLKYRLALPKGTAIQYRQSAGQTDISGEYGDVNVQMSAGDLHATRLTASALTVTMSAGDVALTGVKSPTLTLDQSAGNTTVKFDAAPSRVSLKQSAGNTDVWLPKSSIYKVNEKHSAGNVKVADVPTNPGAVDHTVDIEISAGNVSLKGM